MRASILATLVFALVCTACGKDAGNPVTQTSGTPATATFPTNPSGTSSQTPSSPALDVMKWTGTVEKLGISIEMQGTHKLVDGGKTVVLLKSAKVDLVKYEGKKVTVTGASAPTVEGNQTIIDVRELSEVR